MSGAIGSCLNGEQSYNFYRTAYPEACGGCHHGFQPAAPSQTLPSLSGCIAFRVKALCTVLPDTVRRGTHPHKEKKRIQAGKSGEIERKIRGGGGKNNQDGKADMFW